MDVIKLFVEEPAPLEILSEVADPDARRRDGDLGSIDPLLDGRAAPSDYARAYLAGTRLSSPPRVGLTALADADAFVAPLLAWAGARAWTRVDPDGRGAGLLAAEAAAVLADPSGTAALVVASGPVPAHAVSAIAAERRRASLSALRALLDADPDLALLVPEPAHDGHDWTVWARAPLADPLADAFRQRPAGPDLRRFWAPVHAVRGEHTFYFEQWALDAPPAGVEPL